jgi:hypothetical protein
VAVRGGQVPIHAAQDSQQLYGSVSVEANT